MTLNGIMKNFFTNILLHEARMKKYSQLHKVFVAKYLFWNRIQEITKVWSYMVRQPHGFTVTNLSQNCVHVTNALTTNCAVFA